MKLLPALIALLPSAAMAALQITNPAAMPSANIVVSSTQSSSTLQWRNDANGNRVVGQSFYAPRNFEMDAITFTLAGAPGAGFPGAAMTLTVYELKKPDESVASLQPLSVQWGTIPATVGGSGTQLHFDIDNLALEGGRYYLVTLSLDVNATNRNQQLRLGSADPNDTCKLGKSYSVTNGSPLYSTADLAFCVIEKPPQASVSATSGADNVVLAHDNHSSGVVGYQWRNDTVSGRRDLGQMFRAPRDFLMNALSLHLFSSPSTSLSGSPYTVKIYGMPAPVITGTTTTWPLVAGDPLLVWSSTLPSFTAGATGFLRFPFPPLPLKKGNYYLAMLSLDQQAAGMNMQFFANNTVTSYPDGIAYENTGPGIVRLISHDLHFTVEEAPPAVSPLSATPPAAALASNSASTTQGIQLRYLTSGTTPWRDVGQSFQSSRNCKLDRFTVSLQTGLTKGSGSFEGGACTVRIYQLSSATAAPAGPPICVQTHVVPTLVPNAGAGAGSFLTFDIQDVALTKDAWYLVMLSLPVAGADRQAVLFCTDANPYADGAAYQDLHQGAGPVSMGPTDLQFWASTADPVSSADFWTMWQQATSASALAATGKTIIVPPGAYQMPTNGLTLDNSNGALTNLSIKAYGATFVSGTLKTTLTLVKDSGLSIRGLTVDYDPLPFTQGVITEKGSNFIRVRIDDGYEVTTAFRRCSIIDPVTRHQKINTNPIYPAATGTSVIVSEGNRILKIPVPSTFDRNSIAVGDLFALGNYSNAPIAVHMAKCENILLEDFTIHASPVMGIIESGGPGANVYRRLKIIPGPLPALATAPRLRSVIADGIHNSGVEVGPLVEDSEFADNSDDGIALHGRLQLVIDPVSANEFVGAAEADDAFEAGDLVDIITPSGAVSVRNATIASVTPLTSYANLQAALDAHIPNEQHGLYTKVFQIGVNTSVVVNRGDRIVNRNKCSNGFTLRRNRITYNRGRGMMIRSSSGVIEDNIIDGSSRCAIALTPDLYWNESSYSTGLTIRRNTFSNIGHEANLFVYSTVGAVTLSGNGASSNIDGGYYGNGVYASAGGHDGVTIENNTFKACRYVNLLVTSAKNITIKNNAFSNTHPATQSGSNSYGSNPYAVVWITQTQGLTFDAFNSLTLPGPYTQRFLETTATVTGVNGDISGPLNWHP